jgi:hypothetical protein
MFVQKLISKVFSVREGTTCPRCGKRMTRIKRKGRDRLLSVIVPVIRCGCCGKSYLVMRDGGGALSGVAR